MMHVHRAERADRLVDVLADVLARPLADPMAAEVVAVHSRGIERWLAQELSARLGTGADRADGVCANVDFPFPGRLVGRALAAAGGVDPEADPWAPERLVWPLLEIIDACLHDDWLAALRAHLRGRDGEADATRRARRFAAARHLADLFDRYAVHRPGLLASWEHADQGGAADWQAQLWQRLRRRLAAPSPPQRLDDAVAALRDGRLVLDLPERLSLFGLTALPSSYLRLLDALGTTRDVHLFLLHPSPELWAKVADRVRRTGPPTSREQDRTRGLAAHPLLASWGRDAREMQLVVGARGRDRHHPLAGTPADSLLRRLQADIRADRAPAGIPLPGADHDGRGLLEAGDRSVTVHSCHGRTRQVEVLRDAILHLLAEDETLEPRDIVVLCPDIEAFAPLVHAVFGAHAVADDHGHDAPGSGPHAGDAPASRPHADDAPGSSRDADDAPGSSRDADGGRLPDLRLRLADRSIRQTNPVLRVVAELLDLADGRLTASQVCDFAAREPVRRRFRFDDDDLERLDTWVDQARIRWGVDGRHRAAFGLDGVDANTWRAGLDRLLLGVAMADEDERMVGGVVPLDDVEGRDADLAGRVAELVDRLRAVLDRLGAPRTVEGWRGVLGDAADALTATGPRDRWQALQLHRVLDETVAEATSDGRTSPVELALPEVRTLLSDRLRGRPSRANHRTGDLTVCTLVPMRAVPHRVVCLLGMDDGAFPRRTAGDGDDLLEADPHVGDRDPRTEDRQLLLDALLSATDTVVVTYAGRDECTNERRPPSVPVGELLDVIDRTVRTPDGTPASATVAVEHPLQPFDPRNFRVGELLRDKPWGFDRTALAGARAEVDERAAPRFLAKPLAPLDETTVSLDELTRFFEHPVRAFLRRRLDVVVTAPAEQPSDAIPVELTPLEQYALGQGLLDVRLGGGDEDRWVAAERARGRLPPGPLADAALDKAREAVAALLAAAAAHADVGAPRASLDVAVDLGGGRTLLGTVPDVAGDALLAIRYAKVSPRHRIGAWVRLLAATAAHPYRALRAVTVGRADGAAPVTCVCVPCLGPDPRTRAGRARRHLAQLVDLYDRGMREPLPLYCKTSAAWAGAPRDDRDPEDAARKAWVTRPRALFVNEDADPAHTLVLGGVAPFEQLLSDPPCDDEAGHGWTDDQPTRFGRYAHRLWDGLLACEEVDPE